MPVSNKVLEPWPSFLRELDEKAAEETRLDCMGGFVVTQLYGFSRETSDLDVLDFYFVIHCLSTTDQSQQVNLECPAVLFFQTLQYIFA